MRKLLIFALLLTLVAMLTGCCVDSERCWTLPLEGQGSRCGVKTASECWCARTGTFRYAFVVRNIEALRVEDNFILTRGGESYTFVETPQARSRARRAERTAFAPSARRWGWTRTARGRRWNQPARGGGGRLASPLRRHHAPGAGRWVTSAFGGYADGELPEPLEGLYMNSHGGFHGDGASFAELRFFPEDGEAVERLLAESGWLPLPATGPAASYMGDRLPGKICSMDGVGPIMPEAETAGGACWTRRRATTAISPISSSGCTTRTRRRCTTGNMTPEEGRGCDGCAKGRSSPCCSRSYR